MTVRPLRRPLALAGSALVVLSVTGAGLVDAPGDPDGVSALQSAIDAAGPATTGAASALGQGRDGGATSRSEQRGADGADLAAAQARATEAAQHAEQLVAAAQQAQAQREADAAAAAAAAAEAQRQAEEAAKAAAEQAARQAAVAAAQADPRSVARQLAAGRGWGAEQFACLDHLWTKESGWSYRADNPHSSAYGIPQALPGAKMASAGSDWRDNPATQITWGLGYIAASYGTPCAAWAHSRASNWY